MSELKKLKMELNKPYYKIKKIDIKKVAKDLEKYKINLKTANEQIKKFKNIPEMSNKIFYKNGLLMKQINTKLKKYNGSFIDATNMKNTKIKHKGSSIIEYKFENKTQNSKLLKLQNTMQLLSNGLSKEKGTMTISYFNNEVRKWYTGNSTKYGEVVDIAEHIPYEEYEAAMYKSENFKFIKPKNDETVDHDKQDKLAIDSSNESTISKKQKKQLFTKSGKKVVKDYYGIAVYFHPEATGLFTGGKSKPINLYTDNSTSNDCLYNCLKFCLNNKINNTPANFKRKFDVNANDKFPMSKMKDVELFLKSVKIIVTGDIIYNSSVKKPIVIHLKLINSHFTVDDKQFETEFNPIHTTDKIIIIYDSKIKCIDETIINGYDGKNKIYLSIDRNDYFYHLSGKSKYMIVEKDNKLSFKEHYIKYMKSAELLYEKSNGIINLLRNSTTNKVAQDVFRQVSFSHDLPENIRQEEANILSNAMMGALMFSEKNKLIYGYKYDVVSMYPSLMNSTKLVPMKEGEFDTITGFGEYIPFGIYNCKIDEHILFRQNKNNWYTHIDIRYAKSVLGLNVEIIEEHNNAYVYSRDKLITMNELFASYINLLYPLKNEGISDVKPILNTLWGGLVENVKNKEFVKNTDVYRVIPDDSKLLNIHPSVINDNETVVTHCKNDMQFKTNYARVSIFLVAYAREKIATIIKPYEHRLKQLHTDGFILSKKPKDIIIGDKLGDLKFEKEGYCNISACNNVKDEFNEKF